VNKSQALLINQLPLNMRFKGDQSNKSGLKVEEGKSNLNKMEKYLSAKSI